MSRRASQRRKRFNVFDFADEDERIEKESAEFLARFKKPKRGSTASPCLNKYNFLQCFVRQNENSNRPIDLDDEVADCSSTKRMEVSNLPIELDSEVTEPQLLRKNEIRKRLIDLDFEEGDCSRTKQKDVSTGLIVLDSECTELQSLQSLKTRKKSKIDEPIDIDAKEVQAIKPAEKLSIYNLGGVNACVTSQQCTFPACCPVNMGQEKISELDSPLQYFSSSYKNEPVSVISDDDDRIEIMSSSVFTSPDECRDSLEEQLLVHASEGHEIVTTVLPFERENVKVVISPDFMFYRGMYCTEGQLTFSKTCLKFKGSTVNGTKKKISFVWTVGDIISIDAQWLEGVETAIMNLVLLSKKFKRAGNENEPSAIGLLKFSVCDPCWSEREKAIKSLSVRYKDIWNAISEENEENAFMGQSKRFLSKPFFSDFHEHFEEVIYPKGDPDAISISKRDVAFLQPETFINDTIIDFYIKYLKNKIQPEEQHRFHFFNSFFFRKLADLDKGLSSACQLKAAFERVRKWTRKVDIFAKDYIFIPVNYSLHWSLIVICHTGEVANSRDDGTENLLNVPCILHMNSIRGSHRGLKNLFQSYLSEEWKERHGEAADDVPSNFLHLQFVQLEVPQQENSFDCGLFLLHYMELFLLQASPDFCPFKLNMHWFPPAEASLKRFHIKKLICEIFDEQSCFSTSLLPVRSEQETGVQIGSSAKTCYGYSSNSTVNQGPNNFALPAASPPIVLRSHKELGLEGFKFYGVDMHGGSLSHGNYQQINTVGKRNAMSPIEEIEETREEIAADLLSGLDGQKVAGPVTKSHLNMRYPSKDFRLRTSWNRKTPLHFEDSAFNKLIDSLDVVPIVSEACKLLY
ncbi:probable ubiquitin-like-specific protease 2A isoform X1 [Gossypium hirsutum]|uniref:Probable ubiquitin-like-specific protease 2A isoform X1 n=1 Tax=Gossypium hirsutum TaxID=3635 RepID=A0ABM2ZQZ7_GOSHI|nr:probable ubiquitin-like-specific protease 2A isoform X1 [Gossypium hirsutum]XP_040945079.1 probable ubiquitin-like-specific protease 2A isoform X1 [Gossypium hirsutum]